MKESITKAKHDMARICEALTDAYGEGDPLADMVLRPMMNDAKRIHLSLIELDAALPEEGE